MARKGTIADYKEKLNYANKVIAELRQERKELKESRQKCRDAEEKAVKDLLRYKYDTDARIDRMKITFADAILKLTEASE